MLMKRASDRVVLVTILVVVFIIRRRRRQLKAEDLKNQDLEIDDIAPSHHIRSPYANGHYPQTNNTNEFSLGPPSMHGPSPARSFETLDSEQGPYTRSDTPVMNDKSNASWESVDARSKR